MNSRFVLAVFLSLCFFRSASHAQRLSALAERPDWSQLEAFQETITRDEFQKLLNQVYAPNGASKGIIEIETDAAAIKTTLTPPATWRLRFAKDPASEKTPARFWRPAASLPAPAPDQPLAGLKITLDPGHLGGAWAKMEERFYQIGESRPVVEGDMTLRVAGMLTPKLRALGAEVASVRDAAEPVTDARPETLRKAARSEQAERGIAAPRESYDGLDDPLRASTVQAESELLFYRISESGGARNS